MIKNISLLICLSFWAIASQAAAVSGGLYWSDGRDGNIYSANLDGGNAKVIISTSSIYITGIAVDTTNSMLYWNDRSLGSIYRANLDGTGVEQVVSTPGVEVRNIALDVDGGDIYWTAYNNNIDNGVYRSGLDGTLVEKIHSLPVVGSDAHAIALDTAAGQVYWTDEGTDAIHVASMDGTGTIQEAYSGFLAGGRGLAIDEQAGTMYWTDRLPLGKILSANLNGTDVVDIADSP